MAYLQSEKTCSLKLLKILQEVEYIQRIYINNKDELVKNEDESMDLAVINKNMDKKYNIVELTKMLFNRIVSLINPSEIPSFVALFTPKILFSYWGLAECLRIYESVDSKKYIISKSTFCSAPKSIVSRFLKWIHASHLLSKIYPLSYTSYDLMIGDYGM